MPMSPHARTKTQKSTKLGQYWPNIDRFWLKSTTLGRCFHLAGCRPNVVPTSTNLATVRPTRSRSAEALVAASATQWVAFLSRFVASNAPNMARCASHLQRGGGRWDLVEAAEGGAAPAAKRKSRRQRQSAQLSASSRDSLSLSLSLANGPRDCDFDRPGVQVCREGGRQTKLAEPRRGNRPCHPPMRGPPSGGRSDPPLDAGGQPSREARARRLGEPDRLGRASVWPTSLGGPSGGDSANMGPKPRVAAARTRPRRARIEGTSVPLTRPRAGPAEPGPDGSGPQTSASTSIGDM